MEQNPGECDNDFTYCGVVFCAVVGHHPAFSGDQSYFRDDDTGKAESSAWATVSHLA